MSFNYINQVLFGDCLVLLKNLPDNCIPLVIADLPYGIANDTALTPASTRSQRRKGFLKTTNETWGDKFQDHFEDQDYVKFVEDLALELKRVCVKDASLCIYHDLKRPYLIYPLYRYFKMQNVLVFPKKNPAPQMRRSNFRSSFEMCSWFTNGEKPRVFHFLAQEEMLNFFPCVRRPFDKGFGDDDEMSNIVSTGYIGDIADEKRWHPTMKYRWMVDPLVEILSNPGDLILDPVCGSGTTLLSARDHGDLWCGMEREEPIYKQCLERMRVTPIRSPPAREAGKVKSLASFGKKEEERHEERERGDGNKWI